MNRTTSSISPAQPYSAFASQVKYAVACILENGSIDSAITEKLLNGAAAEALVSYVSNELRAADGIYFTGHELSKYVASCIADRLQNGASIADPTCGAGDLLLACAATFGLGSDLLHTIRAWEKRIVACDLHDSFVEATKARLMLLAAKSHSSGKGSKNVSMSSEAPFDQVQMGDYFNNIERISQVDCVVMNPPFVSVSSPSDCKWAKGNVQLAGVILDCVITNAKDGQEIVAVLPDVLRSGTRYARWRKYISSQAEIKNISLYGRFDKNTDVDVFVIHLIKNNAANISLCGDWSNFAGHCLSDPETILMESVFRVSVGAYVPFRAKVAGKKVPYLCVSHAIPDGETEIDEKCIFDGTLHQTPFVVIRRTSNPSDPRRVIPSLITSPLQVAVENHLIVLSPIDGKLSTCKKLMKSLLRPEVDEWMNNAIRCRHLTTSVVKKLPLVDWL
ncbi:conserved hypothetical protein [Sideroxydans lithotrophicus ES-1]|uniref:site-specific DNA-methyltransferase (adenine-specific) n=2 Tax=Sideroxydans TaxID=314343 RepID=D5CPL3_SIDLE|nr:conserved hypothetical protein [Sideroxydans lithotrophicus ES-1]